MGILNSIKQGLGTAKDVAVGFGKGALDTVASVPRNIKKVGSSYFEAKIEPRFTNAIANLNNSNDQVLSAIKGLDKNDPNYTAKKERLNGVIKNNLAMQDQIRKESEQAKSDYEAGKVNLFNKDFTVNTTVLDKYTPTTNKAQQVGFAGEKIAELIIPATSMSKVDKALKTTNLVNASKLGAGAEKFLAGALKPEAALNVANKVRNIANATNVVARTGLRAGAEGLSTGLTSLGQSAYQGRLDTAEGARQAFDEAGNQALTAGIMKGALSTAGEIARSTGLPQKLYRMTYKQSNKEASKLFNSLGDRAGETVAGDQQTLADWALNKGIVGPVKKQARTVMKTLDESERAVIDAAQKSNVNIVVDDNLKKLATDIANEYADFGKGEKAKEALNFLSNIGEDGAVSVEDAIKFRRTLDGLRPKSSFVATKAGDNISYWADSLRGQINDIPALGQINKDYAMAMKARDALINKAKSENNKMVLGALEAYTAAMPLMNAAEGGANSLSGLAVVSAKRALNNPAVQTNLAQGLNKLGDTTVKNYGMRQVFGKAVAKPELFGLKDNELGFSSAENTNSDLGFVPENSPAPSPAPVYKPRTDYKPTKSNIDLGFVAIE